MRALEGDQPLGLEVRFHSLGDDAHPQLLRQVDDARHDGGVVVQFPDSTDEGPVDLERIQTVPVEVGERREAGSEVVEVQLDRNRSKLVESCRHLFRPVHQEAFGDLEPEGAGEQASRGDGVADLVHKGGLIEESRRDVY